MVRERRDILKIYILFQKTKKAALNKAANRSKMRICKSMRAQN